MVIIKSLLINQQTAFYLQENEGKLEKNSFSYFTKKLTILFYSKTYLDKRKENSTS